MESNSARFNEDVRQLENIICKEELAILEAFRRTIVISINTAVNTECSAESIAGEACSEAKHVRKTLAANAMKRFCTQYDVINFKEHIRMMKRNERVTEKTLNHLEEHLTILKKKLKRAEIVTKKKRNSLMPWEESWHEIREKAILGFLCGIPFPSLLCHKNDKYYCGIKPYLSGTAICVKIRYFIIASPAEVTTVATLLEWGGKILKESFTCIYVINSIYNSHDVDKINELILKTLEV